MLLLIDIVRCVLFAKPQTVTGETGSRLAVGSIEPGLGTESQLAGWDWLGLGTESQLAGWD